MTQILLCLAKDFIVLASDRRLTRKVDGKVKLDDDNSNKALIYSSHFAFAYTGLAKLDDQYPSAIDWAAQQLSEKANIGDAVIHLGNRASDLINLGLISRGTRLAFVGAGFADIEEDGKRNRKALRIVISNFFRNEVGAWTAVPYNNFRVHFHWLPEDRNFELFVGGQSLDKDRESQLNRILEQCMRNKVKPEMIGRLLTREIQKVAALYKTIGKNIMCVMVPRPSGDRTSTWTYCLRPPH